MNGTWNVECRRRPGGGYTCELMVDSSAGLVSVRGEALPVLSRGPVVERVGGLGATLGGIAGGIAGAFAGGAGAPAGAAAGAALGAGIEAALSGGSSGPVVRPGGLPAEGSATNLLRILQHVGAQPFTTIGQLRGLLNAGLTQNWAGEDHRDARRLLEVLPPFGQYENTQVGPLENLAAATAQRAATGQSGVPFQPSTTPTGTTTTSTNGLALLAPFLTGMTGPTPTMNAGSPLGVLGALLGGGGNANPLAGLAGSPQLLGALLSPQLLGLVMQNPQLLSSIVANPQLLGQLLSLAPYLTQNPQLLSYLGQNPQLLSSIVANPQLLSVVAANPQLLSLAGQYPQLLSLLPLVMQNPQLLSLLPLLLRGGIAPTPTVSGLLPEDLQGPAIATYGAIHRAASMVPQDDAAVRALLGCARAYLDAVANTAAGIPGGPGALARAERAAALEGGAARDGRRLALAGLMRGRQ